MILRRLGNKKKLAKELLKHFPPHKIYIEPFFGAGGMFFNKPKAHNNLLNDLDGDVFNLFQVVTNKRDELLELFNIMPYDQNLLKYWLKNKEVCKTKKALRFLFLSNYVLNGVGSTIRLEAKKNKYPSNFAKLLDKTNKMLFECSFANMDYRKFIQSIAFINDGRNDQEKTFIYSDPPYLGTKDNYSDSFTEQDTTELFDTLISTGCKFAISEFGYFGKDEKKTLAQELAEEHGLNVIIIGERQNLKNKRIEILITNYPPPQPELF